jgi:glycosyltransferase involved in cell wall biosynthesis
MDIFILHSRAEGLSNALMEAMSAGLPCIATNIGGNSDLINPASEARKIETGEFIVCDNGILVNPNDPVGLKRAIDCMVSAGDSLRERLGQQAREWIRNNCSLERVVENYLNLYHDLLKK